MGGVAIPNYYAAHLSGERLRRCYTLAPPRVQQYLDAEIAHVLTRLDSRASVLELGCGFGRVLVPLAANARRVVGIDTSLESLALARELTRGTRWCTVAATDAAALGFRASSFDVVVCIQNGIAVFGSDPETVFGEALRVTRPGGRILFSSYSEQFWPDRLEWFERQAAEGLVGAIDRAATRPGEIVCQDGFRAGTWTAGQFAETCRRLGVTPTITEVDESSIFCEVAAA